MATAFRNVLACGAPCAGGQQEGDGKQKWGVSSAVQCSSARQTHSSPYSEGTHRDPPRARVQCNVNAGRVRWYAFGSERKGAAKQLLKVARVTSAGGWTHGIGGGQSLARGGVDGARCLTSRVSVSSTSAPPVLEGPEASQQLLYRDVVFDMDGTLTVSNIDFKLMRERTGIPQGDLFTVMDTWNDPSRVTAAHDAILEFEAAACADLQLQPGLTDLLSSLRERGARVGLVTRNTTISVNAFFASVGEEWRDLFSIVLTREFRYVKPDKRLLVFVADQWCTDPSTVLMVGDSREDVECGKAAGTATCHISGGGNEVAAVATSGAEPTFRVSSLTELKNILLQIVPPGAEKDKSGRTLVPSGTVPETADEVEVSAGLRFVDSLLATGVIRAAFCSYPRLAGAFGGQMASTREGDKILHLNCGDGSLTKLLASQGMTVIGADSNPLSAAAAFSRGLAARHVAASEPLTLATPKGQPVNIVLSFTVVQSNQTGDSTQASVLPPPFWGAPGYADRIWDALVLGGHFTAGYFIYHPHDEICMAAAGAAIDSSVGVFTKRGFILTRQSAERWPQGILVSVVCSKPGLASF